MTLEKFSKSLKNFAIYYHNRLAVRAEPTPFSVEVCFNDWLKENRDKFEINDNSGKKPTIKELEEILNSSGKDIELYMLADGEIRVKPTIK